MDDPGFNATTYINSIFPNAESLNKIDDILEELDAKLKQTEKSIQVAVREQAGAGITGKQDLQEARKSIEELFVRIQAIAEKADQSERMVQEICHDIKSLDYAKKNITATITTLKRVHMLVMGVGKLKAMANRRAYVECAPLLQGVTQLSDYFENYCSVSKIADLMKQLADVKRSLRTQIFDDFATLLGSHGPPPPRLADACSVIEAIGEGTKKDLLQWFCNIKLADYKKKFALDMPDGGALDKVHKRYEWLWYELRIFDAQYGSVFPASWSASEVLCHSFGEVTRRHLQELLESMGKDISVPALLHALENTLGLEEELKKKYGEVEINSHAAAGESEGEHPRNSSKLKFEGMISPVFQGYLSHYVSAEKEKLQQLVVRALSQERWEGVDVGTTAVIASCNEIFLAIKLSLKRCSKLVRTRPLYDLYLVFVEILKSYSDFLKKHIPREFPLIIPSAMSVVCLIINTSEYAYEILNQLQELLQRMIDDEFVAKIDLSGEMAAFSSVIADGINAIVESTRASCKTRAMDDLSKMQLGNLEIVGDTSPWVNNGIRSVLEDVTSFTVKMLSPSYFKYLCDKLVAGVISLFLQTIMTRIPRISSIGAEQLLLDSTSLKSVLGEIVILPQRHAADDESSSSSSTAMNNNNVSIESQSAVFTRYVSREMVRVECILKVLLAPLGSMVNTYWQLMREKSSCAEFERLLTVKGVKKAEQKPLLDNLAVLVPESVNNPSSASSGGQQSLSSSSASASASGGSATNTSTTTTLGGGVTSMSDASAQMKDMKDAASRKISQLFARNK